VSRKCEKFPEKFHIHQNWGFTTKKLWETYNQALGNQ